MNRLRCTVSSVAWLVGLNFDTETSEKFAPPSIQGAENETFDAGIVHGAGDPLGEVHHLMGRDTIGRLELATADVQVRRTSEKPAFHDLVVGHGNQAISAVLVVLNG